MEWKLCQDFFARGAHEVVPELEFIHLSVNNSDNVIHDTCLSRADHDQTNP